MDRPGEREIKRLLGQTEEKTSVTLRTWCLHQTPHGPNCQQDEQRQVGELACWGVGCTGGVLCVLVVLVGYGTTSEMPIEQYSNTGWLKETSQ